MVTSGCFGKHSIDDFWVKEYWGVGGFIYKSGGWRCVGKWQFDCVIYHKLFAARSPQDPPPIPIIHSIWSSKLQHFSKRREIFYFSPWLNSDSRFSALNNNGKRVEIGFTKDSSWECKKLQKGTQISMRLQKLKTVRLTHCGRVTQICVFNTVKLGTSASSP